MTTEVIVINPEPLNVKLWFMKSAQEFCDATIIVNEETIPVHKVVLAAASGYFKNFFQKSSQNVITFQNVDTNAMKLLLKYCYTGIIKVTLEIASEVLSLARILSLNHILNKCLESFEETHSFDKCLSTWKVDQMGTVEKLSDELNCLSKKPSHTLIAFIKGRNFQDNKNEIYDLVSENWVVIDMKTEQSNGAWVFWNDKLLQIGGIDTSGRTINNVNCYDLKTGTTEVYPPMKYPKTNTIALECQNYIFIMGGHSKTFLLTVVEKFDPEAKEWTEVAPLKKPRHDFAAAVLNGSIYIVGGGVGFSTVKSTEVYSLAENRWKSCASTNKAREKLALAAVGGYLYAVGGELDEYDKTIEKYDSSIDKWTLLDLKLTAPSFSIVASNFNDNLSIGGRITRYKSFFLIMDTENLQVKPMASIKHTHDDFQLIEIPWNLAKRALSRKS